MVSISIDHAQSNGHSAPKNTSTAPVSSTEIHLNLAEELLAPQSVSLSGFGLSLGGVVAGARRKAEVVIDKSPALLARIDESVAFLKSKVRSPASSGSLPVFLERDNGYPKSLLTPHLLSWIPPSTA